MAASRSAGVSTRPRDGPPVDQPPQLAPASRARAKKPSPLLRHRLDAGRADVRVLVEAQGLRRCAARSGGAACPSGISCASRSRPSAWMRGTSSGRVAVPQLGRHEAHHPRRGVDARVGEACGSGTRRGPSAPGPRSPPRTGRRRPPSRARGSPRRLASRLARRPRWAAAGPGREGTCARDQEDDALHAVAAHERAARRVQRLPRPSSKVRTTAFSGAGRVPIRNWKYSFAESVT